MCFAKVLWLFMCASMSMESLSDNPVFIIREVLTAQEVLVALVDYFPHLTVDIAVANADHAPAIVEPWCC